MSPETLRPVGAPFFGALPGQVVCTMFLLQLLQDVRPLYIFMLMEEGWLVSGTGGQGGMRLICGTRTAGMRHRTKKEGRVDEYI